MADRDRQYPHRNEEQDWRERDRSWTRESQQQGGQGRRESQWTPEGWYRPQGDYGERQYSGPGRQQEAYSGHPSGSRHGAGEYSRNESNDFERNRAQRDYVFGEPHGGYRGQQADYGRYGSQTGYRGGTGSDYGPSGEYSDDGGYSSQARYGSGWQTDYGAGQQRPMQRRGPKGYKRSDERIKEDVCERLMLSDVDSSEVVVEVIEGRVILEGFVPERRMRYAIEDTAEQAPGVTDVENNVRVSRDRSERSWTGREESSEAEALNRCLRSELSAIETYRQALDRDRKDYGAHREFDRLGDILLDHEDAASRLRQVIQRAGGEPSTDAGAWGTWSKIIMGAAKLFGEKAALKALKEGEESGFKEYDRCYREANLSPEARSLVAELMGCTQRHIRELDDLIAAVDRK